VFLLLPKNDEFHSREMYIFKIKRDIYFLNKKLNIFEMKLFKKQLGARAVLLEWRVGESSE